ncbi:M56 family metallopeptidase [Lachnoclostridium sp.]|uniref:M56 family metallopeptidase n=1 Tax=Lachnoclostridium sp. TaxID=2028282 RepID=UPI0028A07185|nr:M56 family metallopeptidase [Lachnoclostridium sp.]
MRFLYIHILGTEFILAMILIRKFMKQLLPKRYIVILWDFVLLSFILPFFFVPKPKSVPQQLNVIGSTMISINNNITELMLHYLAPLRIICLIGTILILLYFSCSYLISVRTFKKASDATDMYILNWLSDHKLKRKIRIRESNTISSPLTYGILRPVILLPVHEKKRNHLSLILQHEYEHILHFDAVKKLIMLLIVSLYWFNPFLWIMCFMYNNDIEYACDEAVIKTKGVNYKKEYSLLLVHSATCMEEHDLLNSYLSKNSMEERILLIMDFKKRTLPCKILSLVTLIGLLTIMITTQRINASASHNDVADQTNYSTAEETTLQDLNTEKINIFDIVYTPDSINEQ